MGLGSGIRDPGSGIKPILDLGSRGQKGTGSRISDRDPQHWMWLKQGLVISHYRWKISARYFLDFPPATNSSLYIKSYTYLISSHVCLLNLLNLNRLNTYHFMCLQTRIVSSWSSTLALLPSATLFFCVIFTVIPTHWNIHTSTKEFTETAKEL